MSPITVTQVLELQSICFCVTQIDKTHTILNAGLKLLFAAKVQMPLILCRQLIIRSLRFQIWINATMSNAAIAST